MSKSLQKIIILGAQGVGELYQIVFTVKNTYGVFDKTYQLNWEYYNNSLIITNEISVKIIPLKIFDIIS